ncbi:MAG: histidine phosphatase family protein [Pirellulaceae bacterium]|nr:histidine phosphatase family protein [Pirellulaceae bacterium]
MQHLVLVRHGESQLNVVNKEKRVYCGQIDTHLTDFGRGQARDAGERLKDLGYLRLGRAVTSPLQRAHETLSLILRELGGGILELPHSPELMERSHGEFEGLTDEEAFAKYPHFRDNPIYADFMTTYDRCAPGGETLAVVSARAWPFIEGLMQEDAQGDLLVVSHYNTIRCIIGQALMLTPDQIVKISIPNAVPIVLRQETPGETYALVEGLELKLE